MAHSADNRQRAGGYSARHDFFIERPQILQRTSPATDDQRIQLYLTLRLPAVGALDRSGNLGRCARTLHRHWQQKDLDRGAAPAQYGENVVDGGAGRGGDYAQMGHRLRQRLFARGVEQALGQQASLQFLECRLQGAGTGGLQVFDDQLEFAAPLVQRHPAAQPYCIAVLGSEFQPLIAVPEHGAAHLGTAILQ